MTNDNRYAYNFNAENQISSANGTTFVYDGDGERVQKSDGTTYWGGGSSGALVESDNSGNAKAEYIFFNGKRIARRDLPGGSIEYYFADHLGLASVVASPSGSALEQYDYAPFGELHWTNGSDPNHYLFTGKERDSETGLDYFGARYYENNVGRWLSPDWAAKPTAVPYVNYGNPQSLNLYAYVVNRPTTTADPDGHDPDPLAQTDLRSPGAKSADSNTNDSGPAGAGTNQASNAQADKNKAQQTSTSTVDHSSSYNGQSATQAYTVTTTMTNGADGSQTVTTVATAAYFSNTAGHEGEYLGANQLTRVQLTASDGSQSVAAGQRDIGQSAAQGAIGNRSFSAAQGMAAHADGTAYFGRAVAADAHAHPWTYAGYAAGLLSGAASLAKLPVLANTIKDLGLAGAAYHAIKEALK